jgi:pilus assembly protein CpaC
LSLALAIPVFPQDLPVTQAAQESHSTPARDLNVTVGKSLVIDSPADIVRISVANGDIAEAVAVDPRQVLVNGKAPGETSFIVWQHGGNRLLFDLTVRANSAAAQVPVERARDELRRYLPGQDINLSFENNTVFLQGKVRDLTSAERAVAIASTLGKVVNLLYVAVPPSDAQVLLKVRFANVDRSISTELGFNLLSTGATNTIGRVTTGQFSPPLLNVTPNQNNLTLSDALNIFLFRRDLNLGATIQALQQKQLLEVLAEPNLLALNGKPASFLAGGEFPYPILQGGGAGLGAVTIQFREFGVRITFVPQVTPRGTIHLEVAPEVSALDYTNGLTYQGVNIPGLSTRRVHTEIELDSGQSFAIAGLLDNRITETFSKIPGLGDLPVLGKLFQSKTAARNHTELLVLVTPELVQPIPAGQKLPDVPMPRTDFINPGAAMPRTPGIAQTGIAPVKPPQDAIPVEELMRSMKQPLQPAGPQPQVPVQFVPVPVAPTQPGAPGETPARTEAGPTADKAASKQEI